MKIKFQVFAVLILLSNQMDSQNIIDLVPFKQGNLYGYSVDGKKLEIPANYVMAYPFVCYARQLDPGIINYEYADNNALVRVDSIKLKYRAVLSFIPGLAPVFNGKKWGYIDKNGNQVLPFKYDNPLPDPHFYPGRRKKHPAIYELRKVLNLDSLFSLIVQPDTINWYTKEFESFHIDTINGHLMLVDSVGRKLTEPIYDSIQHMYPNEFRTIQVRKDNTIGYIDFTGKTIIPLGKYKYMAEWNGLFYLATDLNDNKVFINKEGEAYIENK